MFISLSKTLAKFGGFRLGVGMRMTKNNMIWMSLIVMFMQLMKAMWYLMIICFWLVYAMIYGICKMCKSSSPLFKKLFQNLYEKAEQNAEKKNQA